MLLNHSVSKPSHPPVSLSEDSGITFSQTTVGHHEGSEVWLNGRLYAPIQSTLKNLAPENPELQLFEQYICVVH